MSQVATVAIVGARGHVGAELLRLLAQHPYLRIGYAGSRALAGAPIRQTAPGVDGALRFSDVSPEAVRAAHCDAVVLALPNGKGAPFVAALKDQRGRQRDAPVVIVDLSADHRFDDNWQYGLVECRREALQGARRIANPGCYATAAQLALAPFAKNCSAPPRIFGVSGYSGAGTSPSPYNDPEQLRDNIIAYKLVNHTHEREIGRHLGLKVHFMPHVASFFRGISLTIDMQLSAPIHRTQVLAQLHAYYRHEALISIHEQMPLVRAAVGQHRVHIGGVHCQNSRVVLVATIDNLLKGAATQCLQNLNVALQLPELAGIETSAGQSLPQPR